MLAWQSRPSLRLPVLVVAATLMILLLLPTLALAADASPGVPDSRATVVRALPDLTTEFSDTYLLSSGSLSSDVFAGAVRFKDAKGEWRSFDTNLTPAVALGTYAPACSPVTLTIGDASATRQTVQLSADDLTIGLGLADVKEVGALVLANSATFAGVAKDTSVTYSALNWGVEQRISLASPGAPETFTCFVSHPGLTLRQDADGQWGFYRPGEKQPRSSRTSPSTTPRSTPPPSPPTAATRP